MGRTLTLAVAALLTAICACGEPHSVAWKPYSMRMNDSHIAERAVLIGEGDVGVVRSAGGLPAGTMTMRANGYGLGTIHEYAAVEAAEFGGTHFMMGEWGESESTSYSGHKVGDSWLVVPHTRTTKTVNYVVIRVPQSGWAKLPAPLRPKPNAGPR